MLSRRSNRSQALPEYLLPAHELCVTHHDVLLELLLSGERSGIFSADRAIDFHDAEDAAAFEASEDVFDWLARTRRDEERAELLRAVVFPALLSDLLHFVYEALENARKGKLTVCYALIRKPIKENLFLLEKICEDVLEFASELSTKPQRKLRAEKAGGLEPHQRRIERVLAVLRNGNRFDAGYLAQLRYDKSADDGFDGPSNQALHLFTSAEAIRTQPLNVNFIFSDENARQTQWYFLYSRLPYVLDYARQLVEHVCASFGTTDPTYLDDIERRLMAKTLLWAPNIEGHYRCEQLDDYVGAITKQLDRECEAQGYRKPTHRDLIRMSKT